MDQPLFRLVQAAGFKLSGAHEWPHHISEDLEDFVKSSDARAIFVVEQPNGLIIGPPPKESSDLKALVIAKPARSLNIQNWDQEVAFVALPISDGSVFTYLHTIVSQVALPLFDSLPTLSSNQARHKLVEAERALASLLTHTHVAFVDLINGEAGIRAQKAIKNQDLNELQSVVNLWKQSISNLTSSDRDPKSGTASEEVSFWLAWEAALKSAQSQLDSDFVKTVFETLEGGKRFHAIHNFFGDTNLNTTLSKVSNVVSILLKDLPIGELVSASNFDQLFDSIDQIFMHLQRKLRPSNYGAQRGVALVESISLTFAKSLSKICESDFESILDSATQNAVDNDLDCKISISVIASKMQDLLDGLTSCVDIWDSQVRDFATLARDLMRKYNERYTIVRIPGTHLPLVNRVKSLGLICMKHAELEPLIANLPALTRQTLVLGFEELITTPNLLRVSENDWQRLVIRYGKAAQQAETAIADELKRELEAASGNVDELLRVFDAHKQILTRPQVRAASHPFQAVLLNRIRGDLEELERISSDANSASDAGNSVGSANGTIDTNGTTGYSAGSNGTSLRKDTTGTFGTGSILQRVVKIRQIQLRTQQIRERLFIVLGSDWQSHADGSDLSKSCDLIDGKFDLDNEITAWSKQIEQSVYLNPENSNFDEPILKLVNNQLLINGTPPPKPQEAKALRALGLKVKPTVFSLAERLSSFHTYFFKLHDAITTLNFLNFTLKSHPRVGNSEEVSDSSMKLFALISAGLNNLKWSDEDLSSYINALELVSQSLESSVQKLVKIDMKITNILDAYMTSLDFNPKTLVSKIDNIIVNLKPSNFTSSVKEDLEVVVESQIIRFLENWRPKTVVHKIDLRNDKLTLHPQCEETLGGWIQSVNNLLDMRMSNSVSNELLNVHNKTMKRLFNWYTLLRNSVDDYLSLQILWDIQLDALPCTLTELSKLLNELVERVQRINQAEQSGNGNAFHLEVLSRASIHAKCDVFINFMTSKLSEIYTTELNTLNEKSLTTRQHLEPLDLTDLQDLLTNLTELTNCEQFLTTLNSRLPELTKAAQLIRNCLPISTLEFEIKALEHVLTTKCQLRDMKRPELVAEVHESCRVLNRRVNQSNDSWVQLKATNSRTSSPEVALNEIKKFQQQLQTYSDEFTNLLAILQSLEAENPVNFFTTQDQIKLLMEDSTGLLAGWQSLQNVVVKVNEFLTLSFLSTSFEVLSGELHTIVESLTNLPTNSKDLGYYNVLQTDTQEYKDKMRLVSLIKVSEAFTEHHLYTLLGVQPTETSVLYMRDVFAKLPSPDEVYRSIDTAESEFQLKKYLTTISNKWKSTSIEVNKVILHLDTHLTSVKDDLQALNAMRASPHFHIVSQSCRQIETDLLNASLVFDQLIDVQETYLNLKSVLSSKTVSAILPRECKRFANLELEFQQLFLNADKTLALEFASTPKLGVLLTRLNSQLTILNKSLKGFLSAQRQRFPRLWFVGDDDVLEIVATNVDVWGPKHLNKLFPGVAKITNNAVVSPEGEILHLRISEPLNWNVEPIEFLCQLESAISESLRVDILNSFEYLKSSWPLDKQSLMKMVDTFTLQSVLLAFRGFEQREVNGLLAVIPEMGDDSVLWSRRRESLIVELTSTNASNASSNVSDINSATNTNSSSTDTTDTNLTVSITDQVTVYFGNKSFKYGYEYLGCLEPLVKTHVTLDLYLSAMLALSKNCGQSIVGPAGTGKTESVKSLGAFFGRRTIVFNCDSEFDTLSVQNAVQGAAQTGSWVCFDEFNRLDRKVLSGVSPLLALNVKKTPLFVTMNLGYSGRSVLPPNMRTQFLEFVLNKPDTLMIAKVLLQAQGELSISDASNLVDLLQKLRYQLSAQVHYDWGLRTLKNIVRALRSKKLTVMEAAEIVIRPRLVGLDLQKFDELTQIASTKTEMLYFDSLLRLSPGVILLGDCYSGKTKLWKQYAKLHNADYVVCDPSAMAKTSFIGKLNRTTREFEDGFLTKILRRIIANRRKESESLFFIVFDGEIEPEWAESLNSVLDETKQLSLSSGELIKIPSNVHFLFETTDLGCVTPATISRCGIMCLNRSANSDGNGTGALSVPGTDVVTGTTNGTAPDDSTVGPSATSLDIPPQVLQASSKIPHIFTSPGIPPFFVGNKYLSMVWSLAGDSNYEGKLAVSDAIRRSFPEAQLPSGSLTNYYVSELTGQWHSWEDTITLPTLNSNAITKPDSVIPTVETAANEYILASALSCSIPLMLVGPPGSGKTMTLLNALRQTPELELIAMSLSSSSDPEIIIQTLEMHCEYTVESDSLVLSPAGQRRAALFIDEINLPEPNVSTGVTPVLQLIRGFIEFRGFYNRQGQFVKLERVQFVGACNPPPIRRALPSRFLKNWLVISVDYPELNSLRVIYSAYLSSFGASLAIEPMLNVYETLRQEMPWEVWTPRELTRFTRSLFMALNSVSEAQKTDDLLARLFVYEGERVLGDRMEDQSSRRRITEILQECARDIHPTVTFPSGNDEVWTSLLSQKPKFVSFNELSNFLQARLSVFTEEAAFENDRNLVAHNDFMQHVTRIDRILRQPQGHALLIGPPSVGKNSAIRFACWLSGLDTMIINSNNQYFDQDFSKDLRSAVLKSLRRTTAIVMGDDLLARPEFVERTNALLANGESPNLFSNVEQLQDLEEAAKRAGFNGSDLNVWVRDRVVKNLHAVFISSATPGANGTTSSGPTVVSTTGPTGTDSTTDTSGRVGEASGIVLSPALINRCTVDFVPQWSAQTQQQIATNWCSITDVSNSVIKALASTATLQSQFNGRQFVEICRQFVEIYQTRKQELESNQRHFFAGNDRLKLAVLEIQKLKRHLNDQQMELQQSTDRSSNVLSQMLKEQSEAERKRVSAVEIRAALQTQAMEIEERHLAAEKRLSQTEPLIKQAALGVQNINKAQLNELKSLTNPPQVLKMTLEAVCIVLGLPVGSVWKQVLNQIRGDEFIPRILNFDTTYLTVETIELLETEYMSRPEFNFERVDRASKAGGPLLKWVLAQTQYAKALVSVKPLIEEREFLTAKAEESSAKLEAIESMLADLEESIETSKREYSSAVAKCESLKAEMQTNSLQISRAEQLLMSLSSEQERWKLSAACFPKHQSTLAGDSLLRACQLACAGELDPAQRSEFVKKLLRKLEDANVEYAELVNEVTSSEIVNLSHSVVLVVDPSGAELQSITNDHTGTSTGTATITRTSFLVDQDTLIKKLDTAVRFGQHLVIQNAELFDPLIMPLVRREYTKQGSRLLTRLNNTDIDVSPRFKLTLQTRDIDSVRECYPLLLSLTTVVDYTVTLSAFETMIIDGLLATKLPELAVKRDTLRNVDMNTKLKLKELEKQLLESLGNPENAGQGLLENLGLCNSLETLKSEAQQLTEVQRSTGKTLEELESARLAFQKDAEFATEIYKRVQNLNLINKFYVVSVQWLWDIALMCAKQTTTGGNDDTVDFKSLFKLECSKRLSTVMKTEDHFKDEFLDLNNSRRLSLNDVISETKPTTPILAGLATLNTEDPGTHFAVPTGTDGTGADGDGGIPFSVVAIGGDQSAAVIDRSLAQAMEYGEILIIQNIEIAEDEWLKSLWRNLAKLNINPNFRLVLTGLQSEVIRIPDLVTATRPITIERLVGVQTNAERLAVSCSNVNEMSAAVLHAFMCERYLSANFTLTDLELAKYVYCNWDVCGVLQLLKRGIYGSRIEETDSIDEVVKYLNQQNITSVDTFKRWIEKVLPNSVIAIQP